MVIQQIKMIYREYRKGARNSAQCMIEIKYRDGDRKMTYLGGLRNNADAEAINIDNKKKIRLIIKTFPCLLPGTKELELPSIFGWDKALLLNKMSIDDV